MVIVVVWTLAQVGPLPKWRQWQPRLVHNLYNDSDDDDDDNDDHWDDDNFMLEVSEYIPMTTMIMANVEMP